MALGVGINPPYNGVDPLTGKFYIAGQPQRIMTPPPRWGGGGPAPHYTPKAQTVTEPSNKMPTMTADRAERYMNALAAGQMQDLGGYLPDSTSMEDLINAYMNGGTGGTGGGGARAVRAVPRWSQQDINQLTTAGQTARGNIGGAWDAASGALQKLLADYAQAEQARNAGAAQTLGAFGAPTQLDIGGMSAQDVLRAMLGQTQVTKAAELANQDAMLQAYQALLGQVK
jgi:hypothetical protein